MIFRNIVFLLVFVFFSYNSLNAQGMPVIEVYTPDDYGDFRQNWDIAQHEKDYLLFGNGNGLVRFDGAEWHSERVEEGGRIVRTLTRANGVIHWGGNGNFGIIDSDSLGALKPLSLREKVDSENRSIDNIWDTIEHNGDIYHRTFNAIYKVRDDSVSVISGETYFNVLSLFGQLVINRRDQPLSYYESGEYRDIPGSEIYHRESVYVTMPFRDGYLLGSRSLGLIYFDGVDFIPFQTEVDDYLDENLIYEGVWINENQMAFATLNGGIVVINNHGEHLYTLTEDEGLPTNIIYNLFVDSEETLWASTDNGIVKIFANDPVTVLNEFSGLSGTPTFVEPYRGRIHVGTTDGLFATEENGKVRRVGEAGLFFDRAIIDGLFYAASNDGLYLVSGFDMEQLHSSRTEKLVAHPDQYNTAFAGSQSNLYRYRLGDGGVRTDALLNTESPIRSLYADDEFIWLALDNRTVHRVDLSDFSNTESFDITVSEDSRLYDLQLVDGKIMLSTRDGIYSFNSSSRFFEPDSTYGDPELNQFQVTRFKQCANGDIWFRNRSKIKRAAFQEGSWQVFENSYRTIAQNQAITSIRCVEDGSVWISSSRDVYHIQKPDWQFSSEFQTNITFAATQTDTLYMGSGEQMAAPELAYDNNNLRFRYAAASFVAPGETEYRVRLKGSDEGWSDWTTETQKDYTFIREGTYSFEVKSRNIFQVAGSNSTYTFTVLPPWYRTVWAYIGYFLLAVGFIYGGHRVRVNSILREQRIRDGIARDLHDELSSTMSSINFFADAIGSKKLKPENKDRFLSLIQKSSKEAKEKISDIVWVIHSENDGWDNLAMRCKRFSADVLDSRGISYTFDIEGTFSGKPTITQRKNIWLMFREIITNIARHSHASSVELLFKADSEQLCIDIMDNGVGFNPDQTGNDGNGVLNIKERINQLHGSWKLQAKPGEGTRWTITLPF